MRIKKLKLGYENLTEDKARIIAHLIGDGCVYRSGLTNYIMKLEVKDEESLIQFEKDLITVYGLKPLRGFNPSGKTGELIPFVLLRAKRAYEDLLSYCDFRSATWFVPAEIFNANLSIKKEFLRALFDDEGTAIRIGKRVEIRLYSINYNGLSQIQLLLQDFDLQSKMRTGYGCKRNVYGLIMLDSHSFGKKIGFNLQRKQSKLEETGERENTSPSPASPPSQI